MAFKLPALDKDDLQSIFDWNTSMQDLWNILDDEVSEILDQTSTLNELKDKLEHYFKDFNDSVGPQGDQLLFKVVDDVLDVENSGSGDGCWIIRNGNWWWVRDTPFCVYDQDYNNDVRAHSYVVEMMTSCMWWGDEELVFTDYHNMVRDYKEKHGK